MKKIFSEGERKILSMLLLCTFLLFIWLLIEPPTEKVDSKGFGYSLISTESIETVDRIGSFKIAVGEFFLKVKEILKK